jgi:prepilin-type N-terminal cleavage/methylation domain-containing protein
MRTQRGFTLVEMAVVVGVVVILLGITTISLVRSQQRASLTSMVEILLADLKQQQLKSMIGDTEGRANSDFYGVHFNSNQYVLFHGLTYFPSDTSNSVVNLDNNMQFNNPDYNTIFSKLSGTTSAATIELRDTTNSRFKRIYLNSLGVVTQVESL